MREIERQQRRDIGDRERGREEEGREGIRDIMIYQNKISPKFDYFYNFGDWEMAYN